MRSEIQALLDLQKGPVRKDTLNEWEKKAMDTILSSTKFQSLEEHERDRHSIRYFLTEMTSLTVGECETLSHKVVRIGLGKKELNEAASSLVGEFGGEDHGQGLDGKDAVSKDDSGVDQKGEHGDKAVSAKKGYLDEEDDDDDEGKGPPDVDGDGPEPGGDFGDADGDGKPNFVDKDDGDDGEVEEGDGPPPEVMAKIKGKEGSDDDVNEEVHKPVAQEPGTPSAGTKGDKADVDSRGDIPKHPDYSAKQVKPEDASKSELNKGKAAVTCESFHEIEAAIVRILENEKITPGSDKWNTYYVRGFKAAISERAKVVGSRLLALKESISK